MKRILITLTVLVLCLTLAACADLIPERSTLPTQEPAPIAVTTETTTEETTQAEQPAEEPQVYYNPINGAILARPWEQRIFSVTICNLASAIPHYNLNKADMFFESFVNGSIIRGVALFSEPQGIDAIGAVRSDRLIFNDLSLMYDTVMCHAGGSGQVLNDASTHGVDHFNIEEWEAREFCSFRDSERQRSGVAFENCLFAIGSNLVQYAAESKGYRTSIDPDKDYHLRFRDDGTPENGQSASEISIMITYNSWFKETVMRYDADLGKYVYHQYEQDMVDGLTGEVEAFTNVIVLLGNIRMEGEYQRCDFTQGGEGWYACGGKAVPITWGAEDAHSALWFRTADGEELQLGRGNTYVAITQIGSKITGIGE